MKASTFKAAPWWNYTCFQGYRHCSARFGIHLRELASAIVMNHAWKWCSFFWATNHFLVKYVFELISLLSHQIWLQIIFGCSRNKNQLCYKEKNNLRTTMIFSKDKTQIPKVTHRQNCQPLPTSFNSTVGIRQYLPRRSLRLEPNSGLMGKYWIWRLNKNHFALSGQYYDVYKSEVLDVYSRSIS